MKKNKMMRIASVLLVAVLLSTCAISGTFAKYVTEETATDKAYVAKWDIDLAGNNTDTKEFEFDLFNTVLDTKDSAEETNVAKEDGKVIIAPGTKGSFDIVLVNNSQVDAQYKIEFTNTLNDVPLTFAYSVDGQVSSTSELSNFVAINMDKTVTVTVSWEWPFNENHDATTNDNAHQGKEISVSATVTVEQVD